MAYCDSETPAVFPDISYGFYKVFAEINNVPYKAIPLKEDFSIDVDDYINEKGTVFIANPNAPTGIYLSLTDIEKLVSSNPNRIVVIDEAYIDFGGESAVKLVDKYDNLLVTQTFSKSRSMAGARLGFGIANSDIISDLTAIKYSTNPYNVNRMTAVCGIGAINDDKYFKNNCKTIIENRDFTINGLKSLGFTVTESKANFVFAKSDKISGKDLYLKLKEAGILVRHFEKERIKDYVRITIGSHSQMKTLLKEIKNLLEKI
jgi:histidinol-phosphate aminotransferase